MSNIKTVTEPQDNNILTISSHQTNNFFTNQKKNQTGTSLNIKVKNWDIAIQTAKNIWVKNARNSIKYKN